MLASNKSMSRLFIEEKNVLHRLRKNCIPHPEPSETDDSFDKILERMNKIPVDSGTFNVIKMVE